MSELAALILDARALGYHVELDKAGGFASVSGYGLATAMALDDLDAWRQLVHNEHHAERVAQHWVATHPEESSEGDLHP